MMISRIFSMYRAALLLGFSMSALAHEGHGVEGLHMHPSDLWGFAVFSCVVALTVGLRLKKSNSKD
jgi:hypothetical protein